MSCAEKQTVENTSFMSPCSVRACLVFSRAFVATASSKMSCQGGVLTWLVLLVCGRSGGFHEPFQWDMRIRVKAEDEDFAGDKKKHSTHFFL